MLIQIVAVDEDALLIAFMRIGKIKELEPRLDVSNASFVVGWRVLEVKRSESDILLFEELSSE